MDDANRQQIDIRLLGPVSVTVTGHEVIIGSPKQRIVLAMLALSGRVSVDALAEELWPETAPASVAATVHTLVSRLRRTVETAGGAMAIRAEAGGYVLAEGSRRVDIARFEELAAAGRHARASSPAEAARYFRDALALWRGPALADLADRDFARIAAVRLDGARLDVAEELADAEIAAGRPAAALAAIEPLAGEDPFRERLRGLQMLGLYRLGRQAEALAAYQHLRWALADELGLEPSPALQMLEKQILQQSPELDAQLGPPPDMAQGRQGQPVVEAPSGGTLAFVFTDIEGSTRRWEGDRAAMAADLARHDAVLREVVAAHGGQLFTHTGDGLGAAFPSVPDALAAALEGQQELNKVAWSGTGPLKVRMAVHAGTAEARAGTFLGPTLNRTARLLEVAVGGQILCSQVAADLARDELLAGVTLVDFGERRLEGLSRPERIWQIRHPDLPGAESLPPAPSAVTDRTTGALTPFVGREAELAELTALLSATRLLTITGFGGAGKTRLALELVARTEHEYAEGTRVVELASVQDDRPLAPTVLSALGVDSGPSSGLEAEEQLCRVLGGQHLLLVLDNCEHVLAASAALADNILRRCPLVTILATSREILSVAGETVWATPSLSLPPEDAAGPDDLSGSDAAELFIVRARAAQPGFGVVAANAGAIARICHRLDGIPLALELAAARARVLSVAQLADRLDDRLRLLTTGPRSAPTRHQTLRAAMDWSFGLLTEPEQRLLRRLSILPQDFELEAATAVAGDDADPLDVVDILARLIDKSLVVPEGAAETARYRLLETVRRYGSEKLADAGETEETRRRHRCHFAERVLSAFRGGIRFFGLAWARQVRRESEHYHAALISALADGDVGAITVLIAGLGYAWWWGTPIPPAVDSVDPDSLACTEPSLLVESLIGLALAGMATGRWPIEAVATLHERALAVADQAGTADDRGFVRYYLGFLASSTGDTATARRRMEEALTYLETGETGRFYPELELGWIELTDGNAPAARQHFASQITTIAARPGWEIQLVHTRVGLAFCEAIEGDASLSQAWMRQAIEEAREIALPSILVMALVRSAEVAAISGAPIGPELPEVLRLLRGQGTLRWVAAALTMAAVDHEAAARPDVAARLLGGAAAVAATLGEQPLPLPAVAKLVTAMRARLEDTLGPGPLAAAEEAGRNIPVPGLLDLAELPVHG